MKLHYEDNEVLMSTTKDASTFKIAATGKAFKIMSDSLYTDKIMAVIRELSTNAYDSHIQAGKHDIPFDVHLPSRLSPTFYVHDHGVGLSHEDVMNLYTTFFESTKTDSNEFVGALGLGSKSPFAYTSQFTIESTFNGEVRAYTAYIMNDHTPRCIHLSTKKTDNCNGFKIIVPVNINHVNTFVDTSVKVLSCFNVPPNLLNVSNQIKSEYDSLVNSFQQQYINAVDTEYGKIISSDINDKTGLYVRQGCVIYPVEPSNLSFFSDDKKSYIINILFKISESKYYVLFDVPIGSVSVSPSRESLDYDRITYDYITRMCQSYIDHANAYGQKLMKKYKTAKDMFDAYNSLYEKKYPPTIADYAGINYLPVNWIENNFPIKILNDVGEFYYKNDDDSVCRFIGQHGYKFWSNLIVCYSNNSTKPSFEWIQSLFNFTVSNADGYCVIVDIPTSKNQHNTIIKKINKYTDYQKYRILTMDEYFFDMLNYIKIKNKNKGNELVKEITSHYVNVFIESYKGMIDWLFSGQVLLWSELSKDIEAIIKNANANKVDINDFVKLYKPAKKGKEIEFNPMDVLRKGKKIFYAPSKRNIIQVMGVDGKYKDFDKSSNFVQYMSTYLKTINFKTNCYLLNQSVLKKLNNLGYSNQLINIFDVLQDWVSNNKIRNRYGWIEKTFVDCKYKPDRLELFSNISFDNIKGLYYAEYIKFFNLYKKMYNKYANNDKYKDNRKNAFSFLIYLATFNPKFDLYTNKVYGLFDLYDRVHNMKQLVLKRFNVDYPLLMRFESDCLYNKLLTLELKEYVNAIDNMKNIR
jgi:hypothetical protein